MKALSGFALAIGLAVQAATVPAAAEASAGIEVGVLSCNSVEGTRRNLLIHSTVDVKCLFKRLDGEESYRGKTGIGLGVDLNWGRAETIHFTVIGATTDARLGAHSLAGSYLGGKASVTVGVGVGAAALIGGGSKNITLQPLAVEGSTGFGAAAGLGYLYLEPAQ